MDRGIVSGPGENCWNVYVNISKLRHRVDCSAKLLAEAVADNGLPGELLRRRSVGAEVPISNRAAHARQRCVDAATRMASRILVRQPEANWPCCVCVTRASSCTERREERGGRRVEYQTGRLKKNIHFYVHN